jgi:hypothetical protein
MKTNWEIFRLLSDHLDLNVPLKNPSDTVAAVNTFTSSFNGLAGLQHLNPQKYVTSSCPLFIKQKLLEKRRLSRIWLRFRSQYNKRQLNKAARELKQLLSDNYNASIH